MYPLFIVGANRRQSLGAHPRPACLPHPRHPHQAPACTACWLAPRPTSCLAPGIQPGLGKCPSQSSWMTMPYSTLGTCPSSALPLVRPPSGTAPLLGPASCPPHTPALHASHTGPLHPPGPGSLPTQGTRACCSSAWDAVPSSLCRVSDIWSSTLITAEEGPGTCGWGSQRPGLTLQA